MMLRINSLKATVFCLLTGWLVTTQAQDALGPLELVRTTSNKVIEQVAAHKDLLEKDPRGIYAMVEMTVAPHFDFFKMSQIALGRYWRRASELQKQQVANEFKGILVRTYSTTLLNYSGQKITYQPVRIKEGAKSVLVSTSIQGKGGPSIPVKYRLHFKGGVWQVFDVIVDGISLVSNYRSTFAAEIRRNGIDGLIRILASRNKKLSPDA